MRIGIVKVFVGFVIYIIEFKWYIEIKTKFVLLYYVVILCSHTLCTR